MGGREAYMVTFNKETHFWDYGDAWEQFPIRYGEVYGAGMHCMGVMDLLDHDVEHYFIKLLGGSFKVDMTYIDPPWNGGNMRSFYTKAGLTLPVGNSHLAWEMLIHKLIALVSIYSLRINYMEMGIENLDYILTLIEKHKGIPLNIIPITYYRRKPCFLIRYSFDVLPGLLDPGDSFNGMDDEQTPYKAIDLEKPETVLDLCAGRGLTGRAAHYYHKTFYGMELNPRRLANLLQFYAREGLWPYKIP